MCRGSEAGSYSRLTDFCITPQTQELLACAGPLLVPTGAADAGDAPGSVGEAVAACLGRGAGMARGTLPAALVLVTPNPENPVTPI